MNEKIIQIKNLYKYFGKLEVLKGVDLDIYKGEVISIIGSSGSGKSTLLRCINLLEYPTSGNIYFEDKDIVDRNTNTDEIRKEIGMVFQSFNLFENMNVLDNCTIAQIKVLKRNAYGYRNFNRFRKRILHMFNYKKSNIGKAAA